MLLWLVRIVLLCTFLSIHLRPVESEVPSSEPSVPSAIPTSSSYYYLQDDSASQHEFCVNETTLVYGMNNRVSITDTIVQCLLTLKDGQLFPGYITQTMVNVSVQVVLNNLVSIDPLSDSVTIDFFLNFQWSDE